MDLAEMFREIEKDAAEERMLPLQAQAQAGQLRECLTAISEKHQFKVGDLVQWKPGLRNKKSPAYGQPIIVVEVLPAVITDGKEESGSCYFREQLDLKTGEIKQGDFLEYHTDSRRFEPYTGSGA